MITITTNARLLARDIGGLQGRYRKQLEKFMNAVGKDGRDYAKMVAPKGRTGALAKGIFYRSFPKTLRVDIKSMVPKPFPYNLWVNQDIETITGRFPYFKNGSQVRYGDKRFRSPSGNMIKWWNAGSGKGYMDQTFRYLEKTIPKRMDLAMKGVFEK